jgi:fatty-acyl-CoA synthase
MPGGEGEPVLAGLMQDDFQLTIAHVLARMRAFPGTSEVVTATADGAERAGVAEIVERVDRLARALTALGVKRGDRVATFAWNSQRHF